MHSVTPPARLTPNPQPLNDLYYRFLPTSSSVN